MAHLHKRNTRLPPCLGINKRGGGWRQCQSALTITRITLVRRRDELKQSLEKEITWLSPSSASSKKDGELEDSPCSFAIVGWLGSARSDPSPSGSSMIVAVGTPLARGVPPTECTPPVSVGDAELVSRRALRMVPLASNQPCRCLRRLVRAAVVVGTCICQLLYECVSGVSGCNVVIVVMLTVRNQETKFQADRKTCQTQGQHTPPNSLVESLEAPRHR
jgi:hypothetical protein